MKNFKRLAAGLLAVMLLLGAFPSAALAETETTPEVVATAQDPPETTL